MKYGMRKPSLKKSIKARTTGRAKRAVKRSINPLYGKKGMGMIKNPEKAIKNKIYHKTTFGMSDVLRASGKSNKSRTSSSYSSNSERWTNTKSDSYYSDDEYLDDYADEEYLDDYSDDVQYDDSYNERSGRQSSRDARQFQNVKGTRLSGRSRRNLILLVAAILLLVVAIRMPNNNHIYRQAKEKDVYNGNHTDVLGKSSELVVDSEKVTDEELNTWYWDYVAKHDHMYDMIIYEDDPTKGVHAFSGSVQVNVELTQDNYGNYENNGITDDTYTLAPDEETHTLVRIE